MGRSIDADLKNDVDFWTPFLIFLGVGFLFGLLLAYCHTRLVKSMVAERLSHIPKAKKVKVKKGKKGKKGKGKKEKKEKKKKEKK